MINKPLWYLRLPQIAGEATLRCGADIEGRNGRAKDILRFL